MIVTRDCGREMVSIDVQPSNELLPISWTVSGRLISVNDVQLWNELSPICVIGDSRLSFLRLEQFSNDWFPMVFIDFGRMISSIMFKFWNALSETFSSDSITVIVRKLQHDLKCSPILVIDDGILISFIFWHPLNGLLLIFSVDDLIITLFMLEQSENEYSPSSSIDLGSTISSNNEHFSNDLFPIFLIDSGIVIFSNKLHPLNAQEALLLSIEPRKIYSPISLIESRSAICQFWLILCQNLK